MLLTKNQAKEKLIHSGEEQKGWKKKKKDLYMHELGRNETGTPRDLHN